MLGVKVKSVLWWAGRGHATCWVPSWQRNGEGHTGGPGGPPPSSPGPAGVLQTTGRWAFTTLVPWPPELSRGRDQGSQETHFGKNWLCHNTSVQALKCINIYSTQDVCFRRRNVNLYIQTFIMQIPNRTNFNIFLLSSISSMTST